MIKEDMKYKLVPPYLHRRNAKERAIASFKDYSTADFHTADPNFLLINGAD